MLVHEKTKNKHSFFLGTFWLAGRSYYIGVKVITGDKRD